MATDADGNEVEDLDPEAEFERKLKAAEDARKAAERRAQAAEEKLGGYREKDIAEAFKGVPDPVVALWKQANPDRVPTEDEVAVYRGSPAPAEPSEQAAPAATSTYEALPEGTPPGSARTRYTEEELDKIIREDPARGMAIANSDQVDWKEPTLRVSR